MRAQFRSRFVFILLSKFELPKLFEWYHNEASYRTGSFDGSWLYSEWPCVCSCKMTKKFSKNTRKICQFCEFTNTIDIINLNTNIRNVNRTTRKS